MTGKLILFPTYLSDSNDPDFISDQVKQELKIVNFFLVENVRTARRFISGLQLGIDISSLKFEVLDKRSTAETMEEVCLPLKEGSNIGLMSEAGLAALADPGNLAVSWAQKNGIPVVPLSGSSSIQLALIASGFNGQQFTFHGYLPIDPQKRITRLKEIYQIASNTGYTQLFMETPFRNNQLLKALTSELPAGCLLGIAADISGSNEFIQTKSIGDWKKQTPDLHKIPAIFSIGTFPH